MTVTIIQENDYNEKTQIPRIVREFGTVFSKIPGRQFSMVVLSLAICQ